MIKIIEVFSLASRLKKTEYDYLCLRWRYILPREILPSMSVGHPVHRARRSRIQHMLCV